jgi:hypothetical protein
LTFAKIKDIILARRLKYDKLRGNQGYELVTSWELENETFIDNYKDRVEDYTD